MIRGHITKAETGGDGWRRLWCALIVAALKDAGRGDGGAAAWLDETAGALEIELGWARGVLVAWRDVDLSSLARRRCRTPGDQPVTRQRSRRFVFYM